MEIQTIIFPLTLSLFAGLSTGIGSLISLTIRRYKKRHLAFSLGFSAGVMIYISFMELLQSAIESSGFLSANIAFFTGMIVFLLIDFFIPHTYIAERISVDDKHKKTLTVGVLTAVGIAIHNFPEGLAVMMTSLESLRLGIPLAFAIALHNIPEGIAVAMPIYYATRSRRKSVLFSLFSGITEPIGALVGIIVLSPFLTPEILSLILAAVAGIMVLISFQELLPLCFENCRGKFAVFGIILGMIVMTTSLQLL